jgi:hypothetical protein
MQKHHESPQLVIKANLSNQEKIEILTNWAVDEYNQLVATEEGMTDTNRDYQFRLSKILSALEVLDAENPIKNQVPVR